MESAANDPARTRRPRQHDDVPTFHVEKPCLGHKWIMGPDRQVGKRMHAETERDTMQTAIDARQRHHGVTARQARDARLGTSLGRLAYQELISSAQYEAGRQFAELYQRHHLTLGMRVPHPRSLAGLMTTAGIVGESSAEPDHDLVAKLRDRFNAATDALDECDRAVRMERGRKPSLLLYRVVCVDEDTTLWPACDLGNLRLALNTLVRAFGMRD
jgi:hypothetical protein